MHDAHHHPRAAHSHGQCRRTLFHLAHSRKPRPTHPMQKRHLLPHPGPHHQGPRQQRNMRAMLANARPPGPEGMPQASAPHHTAPQWHVPRIANPPIAHVLPMHQWIAPHIHRQQPSERLLLQANLHTQPNVPQQIHRHSVPQLSLPPWITEDPLWNPPHPLRRPSPLDHALPMQRHAQHADQMRHRLLPLDNPLRVP